MNELSLFTGAGGGILGTSLLGWNHLGYVEYDDHRQQIIARRIEDGVFDRAPIFGNIHAFIGEGYAASYTYGNG
jgi:DNA (cytosine-5)-methyltransferase 1